MSPGSCSACGKQIPDAAPACPHCGQPAGRPGGRTGLPMWGKILLVLLLGMTLVGFGVATKPSEAELRQAVRAKGKELSAGGVLSPLVLIDDPQYTGRFTHHDHYVSAEIKFTRDDGKVITVARGALGSISVWERGEGAR